MEKTKTKKRTRSILKHTPTLITWTPSTNQTIDILRTPCYQDGE